MERLAPVGNVRTAGEDASGGTSPASRRRKRPYGRGRLRNAPSRLPVDKSVPPHGGKTQNGVAVLVSTQHPPRMGGKAPIPDLERLMDTERPLRRGKTSPDPDPDSERASPTQGEDLLLPCLFEAPASSRVGGKRRAGSLGGEARWPGPKSGALEQSLTGRGILRLLW